MWYSTKKMGSDIDALRARIANLPPEMQEERFREEAERGWEKIEKCVFAFKTGPNILEGGRFDTLSLGTWGTIVDAAGISSVPMHIVALPEFIPTITSNFEPVKLDLTPGMLAIPGMVRLDFCGSNVLKAGFGIRGQKPAPKIGEAPIGARMINGLPYFDFDDRTAGGWMQYVGQIGNDGNIQTPIWWRPWVKALEVTVPRPRFMGHSGIDSWPMEWRVIVQRGRVVGISAYYIQAPIPQNAGTLWIVEDIRAKAESLLAFMAEKKIQPWHPLYIDERDEGDVSFSMDFIATEKYGPLFLEAGPAVPVSGENIPIEEWGAHPCCFMGHKIEGVRFEK